MKMLQLVDRQENIIGLLYINEAGKLKTKVFDARFMDDFLAFTNFLRRGPLPLKTYYCTYTVDTMRMDFKLRELTPKDPDYLFAVRDHLLKNKVGNTKLYCRMIDQPAASESQPVPASGD